MLIVIDTNSITFYDQKLWKKWAGIYSSSTASIEVKIDNAMEDYSAICRYNGWIKEKDGKFEICV